MPAIDEEQIKRTARECNGWDRYSEYVLKELCDLKKHCARMNEQLIELRVELGKLQIKSGIWGLIGACIPVGIGLLVVYLKSNGG